MTPWKGVTPGSPEAKAAAKAYEPPKAIIAEAPPVKAPKPPPPKPPTLEPVIAQPYVPPVGGKAVEWAWKKGAVDREGKPDPLAIDKTKPTVLVTPDGVRYYTPHYHAMWESLGMRSIKDYREYLRTGEPSQYVGITEGVAKPMLVSRRELAKAAGLKGEEQFQALKDAGAIPRGSKFMPGPGGYKGKDWSYLDPNTLKKMKGEILARLARRSTKKPRVVIPPRMRVEPPGVPVPTGVLGGPPMAPVPVKHPAYLGKRQSRLGKELLENPQSVINTLGKAPELGYIDRVLEAWNDLWTQESLGELKLRTKAGIAALTGQAQKDYFDNMAAYNTQVIAYNAEIDKLNVTAGELEKAGAGLPIALITKYNDDMASLNALALSLEREGAGVNLESEGAVRLFNKKVENLDKDYKDLERMAERVNTSINEVDAFNVKVDQLNASLAGIVEPLETPAEPTKTVGNIGRALYEGLKAEYQGAAKEGLTLKQKASNVSLLTAELVVPGVWAYGPYTGRGIKDMGMGQIALNVALDMLIVVPVARITKGAVRGALKGTARMALKQVLTAEAKIVKESIKAMRQAYGKGAAQSLQKLSKLQAKYLKNLEKLERLKAKGKPTTSQLQATLKAEDELRAGAKTFTDEVLTAQTKLGKKGVVGAGFDSPDVARAFYMMPENIARHTKQAFQAITKPKVKLSVKQLKADVAKAEATLQAAKVKAPYDASAWVELVDDLIMKQARLSQKTAGGLANMQQELIAIRQKLLRLRAAIKAPEKPLRPSLARKLTAKQRLAHRQARRLELKKAEFILERQRLALMQKLHRGIKAMDVEWGRGGAVGGGGRVATAVKPRGAPIGLTGAGTAVLPTTATMTAYQAAARAGIMAAVVKAVGKPIPEVEEITKGLTDVEVIRKVEAETLKAIRVAERLATRPTTKVGLEAKAALATEIAERVKAGLERAAKVAPSAKVAGAIKAKTAPITKVAQKVATKVAEKVAEKVPIKPIEPIKPLIIPPPVKTDKEKRKRIRKSKGAIAWRHGELRGKDVFHVGLYPYTSEENYLTVVGKKPQNATVIKGPGSARQSIKLLYGKSPPKTVRGDIGFFDFIITPTGLKTVGIDFKPDPKMQTTGDITIGRKPPPITERPVGLGRGKSPRITPRTPRLRR